MHADESLTHFTRPTAVTSESGRATAAAVEDLDDQLETWFGWAVSGDDLELACRLYAARTWDSAAVATVVQAHVLVLMHRPSEALALLEHQQPAVGDVGTTRWRDDVVLAARVAMGERNALGALLQSALETSGSPVAWRAAYLVAAAAEQLGESGVADDAWRGVAGRYGIVTPHVVGRLVVSEATRRSDLPHAAAAVVEILQPLLHDDPPVLDEPGRVLEVAGLLEARGDVPGARLVLEAARRTAPVPQAVDDAAARLGAAHPMQGYRAAVAALCVLALLLVPLGIAGVLVVAVARCLWNRFVRIPGFTVADSQIWRALRTVRFDAASGSVQSEDERPTGWYGLAGIGGIALGSFVAFLLVDVLESVLGAPPGDLVLVGVWSVGLVGVPVLAVLLAVRLHQRLLTARRDRKAAAAERLQMAEARHCRCWQVAGLRGKLASAYEEGHLERVADRRVLDVLSTRLGDGATLARCTATGVLWLLVSTGASATPVAVRGRLSAPQAAAVPGAPAAPTGFYL